MKTHRSRKCISLSYHEITETSSRHLEWFKKMYWSKRFDAVFPFEKYQNMYWATAGTTCYRTAALIQL